MLVQQTTRYLHARRQLRILLKLDSSKAFGAFDSVSWPFLLEVLEKLGFGPLWRDVISGLLMISPTQILLNGIPGEFIAHRRGLRQGIPCPPYFVLVMDTLNALIVKATDSGLLQPLSSRSIQHQISLYADDVVLFVRPIASDLNFVSQILDLFGDATGLKTNINKSSVAPIQCSSADLEVVQNCLLCKIDEFPIKYLGLPLSLKRLTKAHLQPLIDKLADILPAWKADLMTKAGRAIQV